MMTYRKPPRPPAPPHLWRVTLPGGVAHILHFQTGASIEEVRWCWPEAIAFEPVARLAVKSQERAEVIK